MLICHSAGGPQRKEMLDNINTEDRGGNLRKIIFTQEKSERKREVLLSTQVLMLPAFHLLQIKGGFMTIFGPLGKEKMVF